MSCGSRITCPDTPAVNVGHVQGGQDSRQQPNFISELTVVWFQDAGSQSPKSCPKLLAAFFFFFFIPNGEVGIKFTFWGSS